MSQHKPSAETLTWSPGEEALEKWVADSGAEYLGYREPDIVPSGTPSFRVRGGLRRCLAMFPMHHVDCGGASIHVIADGGEAIVWAEDWLGGCLPRAYADEGYDYGDPVVARHIENAVKRKVSEVDGLLGPEWQRHAVDADAESECPASRAIWVKVPGT